MRLLEEAVIQNPDALAFAARPDNKFAGSVSMLAWAYNEELLIAEFVERAFALLDSISPDVELIIVDDGSSDKTPEILAEIAKNEPRLRVIRHATNLNVGHAIRTAFSEVRKDFFFFQTVDWSYDLQNAALFLRLLQWYDIVKGVRPVPERLLSHIPVLRSIHRIKSRSDTIQKAFISLSNYYIQRLLFGVDFHDYQNIFFARSTVATQTELTGETGFVNPECLLRSYAKGLSILEVPIHFIPRVVGEAKGTKFHVVVKSFFDVLKNWLVWGLAARLQIRQGPKRRIFRVNEPHYLPEEVIVLCAPLFKQFARRDELDNASRNEGAYRD
ncbi:MAG: glycosyltransferase family 2 protein [Alphaproteobacteria bacterium]|nr:glycosyltransferase family 2 protein [Alphaproteobacteria bacterium]